MTEDDPYAILGVARDCPQSAIRVAYIVAAKRAHPDSGGSPEAFAKVGQAYAKIGTPAARKRFDRGETADPKRTIHDAAMAMLAHMIGAVIAQGNAYDDPLVTLRRLLGERLGQAEAQAKKLRGQIERARITQKRLGKTASDRLVRGMIEGHRGGWEITLKRMELEIASATHAKKLIEKASVTPEAHRPQARQSPDYILGFGARSRSTVM